MACRCGTSSESRKHVARFRIRSIFTDGKHTFDQSTQRLVSRLVGALSPVNPKVEVDWKLKQYFMNISCVLLLYRSQVQTEIQYKITLAAAGISTARDFSKSVDILRRGHNVDTEGTD